MIRRARRVREQRSVEMGALISKKEKNNNVATTEATTTVEQPKKQKVGGFTAFRASLNRARYLSEDWVYLLLLGSIMSLLALFMDFITENTNKFHQWAYDQADQIEVGIWRILATYGVWTMFFVVMIFLAALLTRLIAPQAIGSGIPEIKTIFRGVILKEYLTMRTMLAKFVGLTLTIGCGLPLGKEGPLVHMSSVVASQLSRLVHSFQGIYENESRSSEMLAAGCAVGVACTFSAPIGGVLFSIEVTSVFFAVRNYWRGFFAAGCAATISRVVTTLLKDPELDFNAQFQTRFPTGKAFTLQEFPIFAMMGFVLGIVGAAFIVVHRNIVLFLRRNDIAKMLFQRYWMIYPILISFLFGTITYPEALGQFMAGRKKFTSTVPDLFNNCIWSNTTYGETCSETVTNSWTGLSHENSIFISLVVFQIVFFFLSIICSTLPIPAGMFISAFVLGAAFGRTIGEIVAICLDGEIESGGKMQSLYPGVYAVIGAAALAGAITHTVSVCVIVFEVTGQIITLLPIMISVIIAVTVCSYLQPSIYDSVIRIKHLPYLPDIRHTPSIFHTITVDRIMVTPVKCIPRDCTYRHVRIALNTMPKLRAFPVVDSICLFYEPISVTEAKRLEEGKRRVTAAIVRAATLTSVGRGENGEGDGGDKSPEPSRRRNRFTIVPVSREGSLDNDDVFEKKEEMEKEEEQRRLKVEEQIRQTLSVQDGRPKALSTTSILSVPGLASNYATVHSTIGVKPIPIKSLSGFLRSLTRRNSTSRKKDSEEQTMFDLVGEERYEWEDSILDESIDFSSVLVDSTPFQIVSHSSLFKVHSLFSLLGLNRAYVTEQGRLVGVVALKEIRDAIERGQSGQLLPTAANEKEDDEEEGGEAKQEESSHDVYDDDSSDYEDNLQGKLEVVPRLEEATTLVASDHLQLQMMRQTMSSRESSLTNLSRIGSERARWRMDEMTTRRRRKGLMSRRIGMKGRETERRAVNTPSSNESQLLGLHRETTTDDEGEVDQGKEKEVRGPPRIEVKRASEDTVGSLPWMPFALQIDEEDEGNEMGVERTERRHRRHVQFHTGDAKCDCDEEEKSSG
ncbi:clh-3 [Pristionchus pacificus]|uniref:Clh-3 n=1 Tax=Pristionchus pacificus TaxID=54126 RepID=A0A2A6B911_PRIPA|nr:clh-3 [Pristionchus pacificus]|eukprot:PDM62351.1 clh-3 [Pristionchus pacificus]